MATKIRRALAVALVAVLVAWLLPRRTGERGGPSGREPTASPFLAVPPDSAFTGPVLEEHTVGAYTIRVYADSAANERIVDIQRAGRRAFAARAAMITLHDVGRDLTGDGTPDLVVEEFTGGMHCCTQAVVIGLGNELKVHGTINGADGDVTFEDLDHDGIPEVEVRDFRLAYWRDYDFADTQAPEVILRFQGGTYHAACDLMREPAPDSATLAAKVRELRDDWDGGDPPADLLGYAVDLVYQGQAEAAWRFLDMAWPATIPGKAEYVRDLRDELSNSPCWSAPPLPRPAT